MLTLMSLNFGDPSLTCNSVEPFEDLAHYTQERAGRALMLLTSHVVLQHFDEQLCVTVPNKPEKEAEE